MIFISSDGLTVNADYNAKMVFGPQKQTVKKDVKQAARHVYHTTEIVQPAKLGIISMIMMTRLVKYVTKVVGPVADLTRMTVQAAKMDLKVRIAELLVCAKAGPQRQSR